MPSGLMPKAITANSNPMTANSTPPQNSFGCPIFIGDPVYRLEGGRPIMSLLHEPEELRGRDVRLLALLDQGGHLVVADVEDLDSLLGHLAAEVGVLVDLDEHVRD